MYGEPQDEVRDEASGFSAYLSYYREAVAAAVLGLSVAEQRTSRIASGWTPIELLSHVLHMEQRWFVWGVLGEQVDQPWGDWSRDEPWEEADGPDPRWLVPEAVTAESLAERLRAVGERTASILAERDLDEVPPPSPRWDSTDSVPTLRWICFHVLQEYARHAGHLDIAVELATSPQPGAGVEEQH
jgi:uncharacterized damage-inducible protein DinB